MSSFKPICPPSRILRHRREATINERVFQYGLVEELRLIADILYKDGSPPYIGKKPNRWVKSLKQIAFPGKGAQEAELEGKERLYSWHDAEAVTNLMHQTMDGGAIATKFMNYQSLRALGQGFRTGCRWKAGSPI
ncbi:MAG: hypothetical protein ACSHWZ_16380 [Sulfitobacter sp.]